MSLTAALIYWVIVALWLAILSTVLVAFARNPKTFGTARLLLAVVGIDTFRNIVENVYFGLYFGAQYGLFAHGFVDVLGRPYLLIIPKIINVIAACVVLGLLIWRWLPLAARERTDAEATVRDTSIALRREIAEQHCLFETSVDLILLLDRDGIVRRASNSCLTILGYRPGEVIGRRGEEFVDPHDLGRLRLAMGDLLSDRVERGFQADFRHRTGRIVTLAFSAVWSPDLERMFVIGRDVTEQREAAARLEYLAHFDQLTGLPNRIRFQRDLEVALKTDEAGAGRPVAVAVLDLDGFKDINDLLGHATGDRVMQEIAGRLESLASDDRRFYRMSGDEFFLMMPGCDDPASARKVARRVQRCIEERLEVDGHRLFVGASAGITLAPTDGERPDDLILNADLALHHAQTAGGKRLTQFQPAMRAQARARQEIENELRRACAEGEFVLHFQPQIRLSDGAVVGAEALIRWQHPERGLLPPATFIDALARSPAASEVGQFVLRSACEVAATWQTAGHPPVRVGVNLFPIQFHSGLLIADVDAALAESGLPPECLELEITENIALGHGEEIFATLDALRGRGIGLAFDDFGTGYASLSYLMRYPLTRIKIDRSFVQRLSESTTLSDSAIVQSIIVMSHNIGLEVVAEGVETAAQAAFLRAHECEEAQGYLFAKPLSAEAFEDFLQSNRRTVRIGAA